MASELGREVFAVPGSPWNPRSRGCNKLIKDGATLVETPTDIIDCLTVFKGAQLNSIHQEVETIQPNFEVSDTEALDITNRITDILITSPADVNSLIRQIDSPPSAIKSVLLEMELCNKIKYDSTGLCHLLQFDNLF